MCFSFMNRGARLDTFNVKIEEGGNDTDNVTTQDYHWYIGSAAKASAQTGVLAAITWLILYNYIIPISLYVSLEVG